MPRNPNRQSFLMDTAPAHAQAGNAMCYVFHGLPAGTFRIEVIRPTPQQRKGLRQSGYQQRKTTFATYYWRCVHGRDAATQEIRYLGTLGIAGRLPAPSPAQMEHAQEHGNGAVNAVHIYTRTEG